jgi:hypothetical protein
MIKSLLLLTASVFLYSCGGGITDPKSPASPREATDAAMVADTVIYDVVIKNPSAEDIWTEACLKNLDREGLVNMIFEAIYLAELIPYDHLSNEPLSIRDIENLENDPEFSRKTIGKIQFSEEWYFDRDNLRMEKRVNSMALGYEVFDIAGNLRGYKPAFMVILN